MEKKQLPVAIIGAGPVGLAAAAHLVKRNLPFLVLEAGDTVGTNILDWGHVTVFSPWRYNLDKASIELLSETGWQPPGYDDVHTGKAFYEQYLVPLANHPAIHPHLHTGSRVVAIGRRNMDKMKTPGRENQPFVIRVQRGMETISYEARAVIDTSGTWQHHNPVGAGGIAAVGEKENAGQIFYGIPDVMNRYRDRYKNRQVLVVGGGHSAINTILELEKLKDEFPETTIHWVLRKQTVEEVYGGKSDDALPARGALGTRIERLVHEDRISVYTPFEVQEIIKEENSLTITGTQYGIEKALYGIDEIIVNTGTRPDHSFLREIRVETDSIVESVPALAGLIDPNLHSCGTVRPHGEAELRQKEKNVYIAGMKSYGRAPTFLMATGYEQVRSVVAALAGDWEAARRVELDLPETGVCSSGAGAGSACCTVTV